jgi:putative methyltransferase (TIGR04325 family)
MFPHLVNAVRGSYGSFAEAAAAAPQKGNVGYDSDQHAVMYDARIGKLLISDYAVLFWLAQIQQQLTSVFDLGGHVGVLYYGVEKRLRLPESLRWLVCDVPTTVARGRELARTKGATALEFTTEWKDGDGCDLLLASGVLQYLEWDLAERLAAWSKPPRYIIVNNTPMYEGRAYVTLQNTELSYNPYRAFNRSQLIGSLEGHGYVLRDAWRTDRALEVPLRPELRIDAYQGFVMDLAQPS